MPDAPSDRSRKRSRSRSRSPPRQRKRPGGAARIDAAAKARIEERQRQREADQQAAVAEAAKARGSSDVVRQHYNAVPQRGREWRRTDSKIRNLRSYNNWVKSVLIQKFSPSEEFRKRDFSHNIDPLKVLDIGCGKGGDLGKWQKAPQRVALYVGVDPAEVSIDQARERYDDTRKRTRGRLYEGRFFVKDGYGEWIGDIPFVRDVGIDPAVGPDGAGSSRWGGGGFDVVTMMFCMHYSFETEAKARGMLRNVAGALKRGGRFIGAIPDSDAIRGKVEEWYAKHPPPANASTVSETKDKDASASESNPDSKKTDDAQQSSTTQTNGSNPEHARPSTPPTNPSTSISAAVRASTSPSQAPRPSSSDGANLPVLEWGNSLYTVRFPPGPGQPPESGVFRPPFGWRYQFFLTEAVESVPEYVVPFEAFRAMAEDYNLELQYRKPFREVWEEERNHPDLGPLADRMNVPHGPQGQWGLDEEEGEAVGFYTAFCFYKV